MPSDRDQQIGRLRASGLTYRQVGDQLGISVGAVAGAISRLPEVDTGNKSKANRGIARKPRGGWANTIKRMPVAKPKRVAAPPVGGIDMEDLTAKTCRWPVTDDAPWKFCGVEPQEGRQYCEHHELVSHRGSAAA